MSLSIIWLIFLLFSKPNICHVPLCCFFYNSARSVKKNFPIEKMHCRNGGHENENKMHLSLVKKTEQSYRMDAAEKAGRDLAKIGLGTTRKVANY
jgi:hypothetical protein